MNWKPAILAPLALLGACTTVGLPKETRWAGFDEKAQVGPVMIRPDALVEDSRCAVDVKCVWAGRVVIDATVLVNDTEAHPRLVLGQPQSISGHSIVLDAVKPRRHSQVPIARGDYRFHFDSAR